MLHRRNAGLIPDIFAGVSSSLQLCCRLPLPHADSLVLNNNAMNCDVGLVTTYGDMAAGLSSLLQS